MVTTDNFINAFATYFVTIDPPGMAAIFLGLTVGMSASEKRWVALRGTLIGILILLAFVTVGDALLSLLGITISAFRVAGGLLLFYIAFEMVFEKRAARQKETAQKVISRAELNSIAVFPLAVPLIAGPGAISASILLGSQTQSSWDYVIPLSALFANGLLLGAFLLLAPTIDRFIGETGRLIMSRLLGILLAALAVQFIADGVKQLLS